MLLPHLLDSSWTRLQHPAHSCPTPQPWKHRKSQAEGRRGPARRLRCWQLTPVWAEPCSFPGSVCSPPARPAVLAHGAHLPPPSRGSVGLIFSHANLSGAEKDEILDRSQALGWFKLADALKIRLWNAWVIHAEELGQPQKCFGKYCICTICNGWFASSL